MVNKVGKPPWIPTEEDIKKVESLAARGMDQQDIALCLGICPQTLSQKKSEFVLLDEAIKRGKAKGIAHVTAQLLKNIDNSNVTAQIFYLKCKAKWREADLANNGDDNDKIAKAKADAALTKEKTDDAKSRINGDENG